MRATAEIPRDLQVWRCQYRDHGERIGLLLWNHVADCFAKKSGYLERFQTFLKQFISTRVCLQAKAPLALTICLYSTFFLARLSKRLHSPRHRNGRESLSMRQPPKTTQKKSPASKQPRILNFLQGRKILASFAQSHSHVCGVVACPAQTHTRKCFVCGFKAA